MILGNVQFATSRLLSSPPDMSSRTSSISIPSLLTSISDKSVNECQFSDAEKFRMFVVCSCRTSTGIKGGESFFN